MYTENLGILLIKLHKAIINKWKWKIINNVNIDAGYNNSPYALLYNQTNLYIHDTCTECCLILISFNYLNVYNISILHTYRRFVKILSYVHMYFWETVFKVHMVISFIF